MNAGHAPGSGGLGAQVTPDRNAVRRDELARFHGRVLPELFRRETRFWYSRRFVRLHRNTVI